MITVSLKKCQLLLQVDAKIVTGNGVFISIGADIEPEMLTAVEEVQKTGEIMSSAAREFAMDPCSSAKRGNMVRSEN